MEWLSWFLFGPGLVYATGIAFVVVALHAASEKSWDAFMVFILFGAFQILFAVQIRALFDFIADLLVLIVDLLASG